MLGRHSLVRLSAHGWQRAIDELDGRDKGAGLAGLNATVRHIVCRWRDADRPAVVRRNEPNMPVGILCLGIPAPPMNDGRKLRVSLHADAADVIEATLPLHLAAAASCAPEHWQPGLTELLQDAQGHAVEFRVFGSLAMQSITGEPYVTVTSDIDLLFRPRSAGLLDTSLALLQRHARHLPLDGEIEFPTGHAVSWREWATVERTRRAGTELRVLAKHMDAVSLMSMDSLRASLEPDHG